jgi:predicted DNA-binding protein
LSRNIRIPDELYNKLYQIKVSLQDQYQTDAPSLQDLVSVAIEKLCEEWEDPNLQAELLEELLESRREARSRMGKRKINQTQETE